MSDDEYKPTLDDWLENEAGSIYCDAYAIAEVKNNAEVAAYTFSNYGQRKGDEPLEYYQPGDNWPPKEFIDLCIQISQFEILAPPKGSE